MSWFNGQERGEISMRAFMITLLSCSFTMSIIVLLYMSITPLLSKRYQVKWRYYAWLVIVIGLVIPFRPSFNHTVLTVDVPVEMSAPINWIGNAPNEPVVITNIENVAITQNQNVMLSPTTSAPSLNISWWQIIALTWLLGMLIFLVYHGIKHYRFVKMTVRWSDKVIDKKVLSLFQEVKTEMRVSKKIDLQVCPFIGSPMLAGFFNHRILLPAKYLAEDELRFIFKHELVHYKRKDLGYKCLVLVATAIHWFNPIVYLMAKAIDIQCELSCDAAVVKRAGSYTRQQYSETMIGVVKYQSKLKTAFSTNYCGGKKGMKRRIFSIMDTKRKKRSIIMLCTVSVLVMASGIFVAGNILEDREESPVQNETTMQSETAAQNETLAQENETEASVETGEVLISVSLAPDEVSDGYDFFEDEYYLGYEPEPQKIMFSTNVVAKDFKFLAIAWREGNQYANFYETTELYSLDELSPEKPLVATWLNLGTMPHRGISFVDENNITRYFYITLNQADNGNEPILLVEFSNFQEELILSLLGGNTSEMHKKSVYVEEITPDVIVNALKQENVLSSDTILNDFSMEEINGEATIKLDFNEAFTTHIKQYGSADVDYVKFSLCNTFLDIYNADVVLVTVDGVPPAAAHFDFSFPVYYYNGPSNDANEQKQYYLSKLDEMEYISQGIIDAAITTYEMRMAFAGEYEKWDIVLNEIYYLLEQQLPEAEMASLTAVQLDWISQKEAAAQAALEANEGGSIALVNRVAVLFSYTQERCYELVNQYME